MKVLLIGSGGRESALAYKLRKSPLLSSLKVYPGNAGFSKHELYPKSAVDLKNKSDVQKFILNEKIDFVVVGPEEPLVDGICDWISEIGLPCFGPTAYCARLEGSKDFAKQMMKEFHVPTARYEVFSDLSSAKNYIKDKDYPLVVKADGLAAGKGVTVAQDEEEAIAALHDIFIENKFGNSGKSVLIEEFMKGEEASVFALCDGENFLLFPASQDHKRAHDGDTGPNTGGMGAYTPAPIVDKNVLQKVRDTIFRPMLDGLRKKGHPYRGLLYAGLMISDGNPRVVEFNCRFGDPETQTLMVLLEDDLLEVLLESANGNFKRKELNFYPGFSSVVVLAAKGYPGEYKKKIVLDTIPGRANDETEIFHAGTESLDGKIVSNGGRILGITSRGKTLSESVNRCYSFLNAHPVEDTFYRKDIARKAL